MTPESWCTTLYIPLPTLIRGITLAEVCPTGATKSKDDETIYFDLLIKTMNDSSSKMIKHLSFVLIRLKEMLFL